MVCRRHRFWHLLVSFLSFRKLSPSLSQNKTFSLLYIYTYIFFYAGIHSPILNIDKIFRLFSLFYSVFFNPIYLWFDNPLTYIYIYIYIYIFFYVGIHSPIQNIDKTFHLFSLFYSVFFNPIYMWFDNRLTIYTIFLEIDSATNDMFWSDHIALSCNYNLFFFFLHQKFFWLKTEKEKKLVSS